MTDQEEKQTLSQENVHPIAEEHLKSVNAAGWFGWFKSCFKPKAVEKPKFEGDLSARKSFIRQSNVGGHTHTVYRWPDESPPKKTSRGYSE